MSIDELSFHDAVSPHLQARYRSYILRDDLAQRGLTPVSVTITEASMRREDRDVSPNKLKLYLKLGFENKETEIVYSRSESIENLMQLVGAGKIKQLEGMRFRAYLKNNEIIGLGKYN